MCLFIGIGGPVLGWGEWVFCGVSFHCHSSFSLRAPVGQMTVKEQQLEGELRYVNSRIITNSEEIAFYEGSKREKLTLMDTFRRLVGPLYIVQGKLHTPFVSFQCSICHLLSCFLAFCTGEPHVQVYSLQVVYGLLGPHCG